MVRRGIAWIELELLGNAGQGSRRIESVRIYQRFRRLTFWNKLGAIGALASLLGIPLAIFLHSLGDRSPVARLKGRDEAAVAANIKEKFLQFDFALRSRGGEQAFELVYCCDLSPANRCDPRLTAALMPEMDENLKMLVRRWGSGWLHNMGPERLGDLVVEYDERSANVAHVVWFHREGDREEVLAKRSVTFVWYIFDWRLLGVVGADTSTNSVFEESNRIDFLLDLHAEEYSPLRRTIWNKCIQS